MSTAGGRAGPGVAAPRQEPAPRWTVRCGTLRKFGLQVRNRLQVWSLFERIRSTFRRTNCVSESCFSQASMPWRKRITRDAEESRKGNNLSRCRCQTKTTFALFRSEEHTSEHQY